ncbi:MAG: tRNA (adenine-N1)-methyltransferase [Brevinematia bacterium]
MIRDGELIYLYNDEKTTFLVTYQKGQSFSTHKGNIVFPEGLEFGDCILSNTNQAFYVLKPTLSDIMMKVKRKTTIVYPKEAGMLILELSVCSGANVIEVGSGSGAFTILLSSMVGEEGRVYSFERREDHLEIAKKNFKRFALFDNVEFIQKDPANEGGFGLTDIDAVFVDVPEPWTIIESAWNALRGGGHIATLSPNIEQVQLTVEKMESTGFMRIRCMEVFSRGIRVKKNMTRPFDRMIGHTAYLVFAEKVKKAGI